MVDGETIKQRQREMWTLGDYTDAARRIAAASESLIAGLGFSDGVVGLDVGCGTGNATLPAARRGARMTGLDLTPKLLELARERAASEGLEIDFIEGDAERLPFDDGSFDRVTSVFGSMFAPDQQRAADEMLRVCAPGGRLGFCAWTPAGLNGRMFAVIGSHMPPPPEGFVPPVLWGDEDHVRGLLSGAGAEPVFERRSVSFAEESVERWLDIGEETLGPMVMAKQVLGPEGKWDAARVDLMSLYAEANEAEDGAMQVEAEYLMTTLDLPG